MDIFNHTPIFYFNLSPFIGIITPKILKVDIVALGAIFARVLGSVLNILELSHLVGF